MLIPPPQKKKFGPYVMNQMKHANRANVVWDTYLCDSLKAETRSKRGNKRRRGIRRRAEKSSPIPGNFYFFFYFLFLFLSISENKTELFSFLASNVTAIEPDMQVISTYHEEILCTQPRDVLGLAPYTQEEADSRIMLHLKGIVMEGYSKVSIHTVDTHVVVLAIEAVECLGITELCVAFGVGESSRLIATNDIANALGSNDAWHYLCPIPSLGVTPCLMFGGKGKNGMESVDGI